MSPKAIINFLSKTTAVFFYLALILSLLHLFVGIRGIIINQNPAEGYHGFKGISIEYEVNGLAIGRDMDHQPSSYSKDKLIRLDEKTNHYSIRVKARSLFNYCSLLMNVIEGGLVIGILWQFMRLFRQTNIQHPFDRQVVQQMKMLASLFILLGILKILQYLTYGTFLSKSFGSATIQADLLFKIGGRMLTGLIIWMIAIIFQRGIELQEENALTV
jgi:hypothetical protein